MTDNNDNVALSWSKGKVAKCLNMWTDGKNIYSYELMIGTTEDGSKISFPYTAGEGEFVSNTTSRHCYYVGKYADERRFVKEKEYKYHYRYV